jgi:pyridoxamine 5'-phosphate oxidase
MDVRWSRLMTQQANSQAAASPRAVTERDPFTLFDAWFAEAQSSEINDPNAMTVATAAPDGMPSARMVLLKEWDRSGFVFYTNKGSRKGDDLAINPQAALLFHWKSLRRQIRIEGRVESVTDAEADEYYKSRPRLSRLGAWASIQSRPLSARSVLEQRVAEAEATYPGDDVPRPPHWSGYRVIPRYFEFWLDMPYRLHDRTVFQRDDAGWSSGKIYP